MKNLYELKNQRNGLIAEAEKHVAGGDMERYNEAMSEVKEFNAQIEALETLNAERGRFEDSDADMASRAEAIKNLREDEEKQRSVDEIRSTNEYARAFANAIRNRANPGTAFNEQYAPLMAALTEQGGTPEGADGGFLVPIDIDNTINELRRHYVALADLVQVEYVSAPTGWRVKDKAPTKGFTKLTGELTDIPDDDQPQFAKVDYKLDTYGLYIPVSRELVDDEDANLFGYLARWFARKGVLTENAIILGLLNDLTKVSAAAGEEVEALKTALNVTLDPAISLNAKFLTNQSGFNTLDVLVDGNNRPLLQPDVTDATKFLLSNRPIVRASDAEFENDETESIIYVGDFAQYMTLFKRNPLEVAVTDVGGDAWRKFGLEIRGVARYGASVFDDQAVAKLGVVTNPPATP